MYILQELINTDPIKKTKTLEQMEKRLLEKAYKQVYYDNLDKQTYRKLYKEITYWNWSKDLNAFLEYEFWVKILYLNLLLKCIIEY